MNNEIVISAKNLTKEYFLSKGFFSSKNTNKTITALNGVNLNIRKGEIVGIIGRNGSGKSTLLKILSQITKPTKGNAFIHGKIVSAIEVSGGFNFDLSGKENIKLIGQIWGLSLKRIKEIEKSIIEFANLSSYIFLPVKKLSTGMIGRLAASIIIHIEADIYIFDETLNGSDQLFTRNIHQKLIDLQNNQKTILIASHKVTDILTLCNNAIVLEKGEIIQTGNPFESIITYQRILHSNIQFSKNITRYTLKNEHLNFSKVTIENDPDFYYFTFSIKPILDSITNLNLFLIVNNSFDLPIGHTSHEINSLKNDLTLTCKIPGNLFSNGLYIISLAANINNKNWLFLPKIIEFETNNNSTNKFHFIPGILITDAKWQINN